MDLHRAIMLDRNAFARIRIMRNTYSELFNKYCESDRDERAAIAKLTMDSVRTVFITVFCTAAASPFWFFPSFSEVNLVRAVGRASPVRREKVEARKLRIDSVPMSVWVRAFVFVMMI